MKLIVILFLFHGAQSDLEVSGYLGNSVTLKPSVDPTWGLAIIKWYIYHNDTLIAICRNGTADTERFYLFKDRLNLNCASGHLRILSLSKEDAMVYIVELTSIDKKVKEDKIKLTTRQHLKKPTVQELFSSSSEGGCWIGLRCESPDVGAQISWNVTPEPITSYLQKHPDKNDSMIVSLLNHTQNDVHFTCYSSWDSETTDHVMTVRCPGDDSGWREVERGRCGIIIAIAFFAGPTLLMVIKYFTEKKACSLIFDGGASPDAGVTQLQLEVTEN